jgi:hypothetical protein
LRKLEIEEIPPKEAFLKVFFRWFIKLFFQDFYSPEPMLKSVVPSGTTKKARGVHPSAYFKSAIGRDG